MKNWLDKKNGFYSKICDETVSNREVVFTTLYTALILVVAVVIGNI